MKADLVFVALIALGVGASLWSLTPKSVRALEKMPSDARLVYLSRLETSSVVAYYCGPASFSASLKRDVETSLRDDHAVSMCTFEGRTRYIPS